MLDQNPDASNHLPNVIAANKVPKRFAQVLAKTFARALAMLWQRLCRSFFKEVREGHVEKSSTKLMQQMLREKLYQRFVTASQPQHKRQMDLLRLNEVIKLSAQPTPVTLRKK